MWLLNKPANMFDVHILSYRNSNMASAMDFVDHFRNDIFDKCHRCSVMLDCYLTQICLRREMTNVFFYFIECNKEKETKRINPNWCWIYFQEKEIEFWFVTSNVSTINVSLFLKQIITFEYTIMWNLIVQCNVLYNATELQQHFNSI